MGALSAPQAQDSGRRNHSLKISAGQAVLRWLSDQLMGSNPRIRTLIGRSLIGWAMYIGCGLAMALGVSLGLTNRVMVSALTVFTVIGVTLFYSALRSGWSSRLADPAMTVPQMMFAILTLVFGYAANPPIRSTALLVLVLVMAFCMFSITIKQARGLTVFALAAFGLTMLSLQLAWPQIYDPRLELIHFMLMAVVLPIIATLAGQVTQLHARRKEQRAALREALTRIERLVRHDELTGLANRRHMSEQLAQELNRCAEHPANLCVCLLDLDHFKRINDQHGHTVGDEVLRRFAALALSSLRSVDCLARWGGEEFLLLLPNSQASQASQVLERLRQQLSVPMRIDDQTELRITFSAGIAELRAGEAAEQLIERADYQAYRAKASGRDCWCCDSLPAAPSI